MPCFVHAAPFRLVSASLMTNRAFSRATSLAKPASFLGIGSVFSTDGAVARSFIRILIFEKDQPDGQRNENRRAGKNHRFEAQVGVNSKADQQQPDDERAKKTNDNAQHTRGKIRAKHVHGRRMSTTAQ